MTPGAVCILVCVVPRAHDAQARLKSKDSTAWTEVDGKIDTVLRELRSTNPNADQEKAALAALLAVLG